MLVAADDGADREQGPMRERMTESRRREPCEQCSQTVHVVWYQEWRAFLCRDCAQEMADQEKWQTNAWEDIPASR